MTFQGLQVFSFRSFPLIITEIQCGQGCDRPHLTGGETDTQGDCRACLSPTAVVVDLHVDMGLSDSYGPTDARCAGHCPEFSRAEKPATELWEDTQGPQMTAQHGLTGLSSVCWEAKLLLAGLRTLPGK